MIRNERWSAWMGVGAILVACGNDDSSNGSPTAMAASTSTGAGGSAGASGSGGTSSGGGGSNEVDASSEPPAVLDSGADVGMPPEGGPVDAPSDRPNVPDGGRPEPMRWELLTGSPNQIIGALGGSGASDVWAVGSYGEASHSTGDGRWQKRDVMGPRLTGVWGAAPDNVYVSGYINTVYHWDGSGTWDRQLTNSGSVFSAIWASGPNDLYAVGSNLFRSTGNRVWRAEPTPLAESVLVSVWGSGANDVWILDGVHNALHSTGDGTWVRQRTITSDSPGIAIWGSGPRDIYAITGGQVMHSTGDGRWTAQPIELGPINTLTCLWGSGSNDIYIGSGFGTVFRSSGDGRWYAEKVDPTNDLDVRVAAIWGSSSRDVYVMTAAGTFQGRPVN